MRAIQVSVFLENKRGRLAEVTKILGENSINIRTFFIADTSDFGILRMIVNDTKKAMDILKSNDFTVRENEVIAVEVSDKPGGLANILNILNSNDLNIEYLYCFADTNRHKAIDVMRVEDIERAIDVLQNAQVKLLDEIALSNL
ncbi:MAG TPA: ACT domain-containing protein [Anaerolineae bacterium]|jgi:hypothetical protein|nr:ACT domain-containing protein [Anaerolineae bacterium]